MPTALITGTNRGLGLEFTRQYAEEGWNIIAASRDPAKADQLQAIAGKNKNVGLEALDVTDKKSITSLAAKLKDTPLDLLINNAGIISGTGNRDDSSQDFGGIDPEAWDRVLRTNTIAPIMIAEAFTPHLARGKNAKIAMITSKMGSIAEMGSGYIAYRTSKAALNAAMVTIAHNLKEKKIAIVNLHPGWVKTDMGGTGAQLEPKISVDFMRRVIDELTLDKTGRFMSFDGKQIAW